VPDTFDTPERRIAVPDALVVDLDGYAGPLDVLLSLARDQKVDLARISILQLADQYLDFIERHCRDCLELAADYLVMAAWLAYLKSRLLLPDPVAEDQPSGEEMAAALAFQLQRLDAMRQCGQRLLSRARLGRDVFARGAPEGIVAVVRPSWEVRYYELLKAYADIRLRQTNITLNIEATDLYSVDDAMRRMRRLLKRMPQWATLVSLLPAGQRGLLRRSALAAHFVATLELCRQGKLVMRQDEGAFGPIWLRRRTRPGAGE
jgi:segregation and condensation protein A